MVSGRNKIAVLPPDVQAQIAAGEVIERPASVVKELVENALDAGARSIDVRLVGGGLERLTVRDDGEGMTAADALLAFARHATSKLGRAEELAGVTTLGFRGEALPSIAAVARVQVVTRRAGEAAASVVEADAAGARAAGVAGAPAGTSVEVEDLFGATPARRKFLRTPATELAHVVDALTRLAAASAAVGFRLEHERREVLALPPVRDERQRLGQLLGRERAGSMVAVEVERGGLALRAFLAPPRETVGSARLVWTYVGLGGAYRWTRDRLLLRAVLDGYESLLMHGRYPVAVLFLRFPPGEVDVNVHPAKLEVRFRHPAADHQLLVPALRTRLAAALRPEPAGAAGVGSVAESVPSYDDGPDDGSGRALEDGLAAAASPTLWSAAPGGFASLRFIGQIFDGYIVCEGDRRVVLIDQHAAHERVAFERLREEHARGAVARDPLLVPEAITLPAAHAAALAEHGEVLAAAGLEGEPFGDGTFLLRTVPRLLRGRDAGAVVRAVARELAEEGASAAAERTADAALATLACHSVVRVGERLDPAEVRALLAAMDGVDVAAHCPHGRPVAVTLERTRIEALFKR
ncbi:MAG: DNA mismatch repair endonuclease MutL [Deltaproteobacteria bacterium]|nr:MAG: DNA mismatch repair endonuclease MutL [Deltaproteobacteria bacterium]